MALDIQCQLGRHISSIFDTFSGAGDEVLRIAGCKLQFPSCKCNKCNNGFGNDEQVQIQVRVNAGYD